jgi:hypothetical protein
MAVMLTTDERTELERLRNRTIRLEDARSARVIVMVADGASYSTIDRAWPRYRDYISLNSPDSGDTFSSPR